MKHIIEAQTPAAAPAVKWLLVDEESVGQRLDNFLMRHLKGVPKTHIYRIIRSGEVRINKGRASADSRVEAGDQVRIGATKFQCKPWPFFTWCRMSAYKPTLSASGLWTEAWTLAGTCPG